MKRIVFYIDPKRHESLTQMLEVTGITCSEFVRQCVEEKLNRDQAVQSTSVMHDQMKETLALLQEEVLRLRKDLLADQLTSFGSMRDDIDRACDDIQESVRKNEEVNRNFLMALAQSSKSRSQAPAGNRYIPD